MNDEFDKPIDLILRVGGSKTFWVKWPLDELLEVPKRFAQLGLANGMFAFTAADRATKDEIRQKLLGE